MNYAENYIRKVASKYHEGIEKLTLKQFESALKQAIECGDFVRYCSPTGQNVVYTPGAGVATLRARVQELEDKAEQDGWDYREAMEMMED